MNKKTIIIISAALIVFILGVALWNQHVKISKIDNKIESQLASNKSNYDNMWKSFKEMTQITELQAAQMKDVYLELITGRYESQDLLFQMVQEQNPNLNSDVYVKIQNQIVAGRSEFDNNQKKISDIIREYNDLLVKYPIVKSITGRENKNPNDYIVTSTKTDNAFNTLKDDEINLLGE